MECGLRCVNQERVVPKVLDFGKDPIPHKDTTMVSN